jgi:hypothetical protein
MVDRVIAVSWHGSLPSIAVASCVEYGFFRAMPYVRVAKLERGLMRLCARFVAMLRTNAS